MTQGDMKALISGLECWTSASHSPHGCISESHRWEGRAATSFLRLSCLRFEFHKVKKVPPYFILSKIFVTTLHTTYTRIELETDKMFVMTIISYLAAFKAVVSAVSHASLNPTNFFLVTTTQPKSSTNSSLLANVTATSLFDPFHQEAYLLRLIEPGYNSLPTFNMTNGALSTVTTGPLGFGTYEYRSSKVKDGGELQFLPSNQTSGNLGLWGGYLLTVDGTCEGWTTCEGDFGEAVVSNRQRRPVMECCYE